MKPLGILELVSITFVYEIFDAANLSLNLNLRVRIFFIQGAFSSMSGGTCPVVVPDREWSKTYLQFCIGVLQNQRWNLSCFNGN